MSLFDKTTQLGPAAVAAGFVGAAAGGIIRWITLQESWRTGLATLVASGLFGGLIAPVFAPGLAIWLDASILVTTAFLAMVLGIFGLTMSKVIIEAAKTDMFLAFVGAFLSNAASAWLSRKTGVPIPPPPATPAPEEENRP